MTNPWTRKEVIGDCTLYLGDCLEVMPALGKVDVSIVDPPYGVASGVGSGLRKSRKSKTNYSLYDDTVENFNLVVIPSVELALSICKRMAVTSGFKRMYDYPRPAHIGSFQYGAGTTVMSCWGPALWQPILYYGVDPRQGKLVPDSFQKCNDKSDDNGHPCPKPLKSWTRLVKRVSRNGETVLDFMMGSGTTGVACAKLGRKFIGIEIDPDYFEIACKRVQAAYDQPDLFVAPPTPPTQEGFEL
jgi:site-specific DNA-methyltransferase (adenine-specific)